jgi:hypothetical protein
MEFFRNITLIDREGFLYYLMKFDFYFVKQGQLKELFKLHEPESYYVNILKEAQLVTK